MTRQLVEANPMQKQIDFRVSSQLLISTALGLVSSSALFLLHIQRPANATPIESFYASETEALPEDTASDEPSEAVDTQTPTQAELQTSEALSSATLVELQGDVWVLRRGETGWQPAVIGTQINLMDAIRTEETSRVDLRFNDGSLARIGEQATFRFIPNTRNFRLSNGTTLLLIPPGGFPSNIIVPTSPPTRDLRE
ncbi:MAG: hypothetical protein AAFN08_03320 [Cyanobacteria bacterium J06559_3]